MVITRQRLTRLQLDPKWNRHAQDLRWMAREGVEISAEGQRDLAIYKAVERLILNLHTLFG
jgi:hypothetical protein